MWSGEKGHPVPALCGAIHTPEPWWGEGRRWDPRPQSKKKQLSSFHCREAAQEPHQLGDSHTRLVGICPNLHTKRSTMTPSINLYITKKELDFKEILLAAQKLCLARPTEIHICA